MTALHSLCRHHGITTEYPEQDDEPRSVPEESLGLVLASLGVDPEAAPEGASAAALLQAPQGVTCYCPPWLPDAPAWGITCQLYELRSSRNWGIGDFRDLRELCQISACVGADFVGVNPLHALFLADPTRCSPFFPSNRRFFNPLYIAVDEVPGTVSPPDTALATLQASDTVDYEAVAQVKLASLRATFDHQPFGSGAYERASHDQFVEAGGAALWRHAAFESISQAMVANGHQAGWTGWPEEMRDWQSDAVTRFAALNDRTIAFHIWLQWIASLQLASVKEAAQAAGMRIGLYLDLAVGEAPDGSAAWSHPELLLHGVSLGAPPDVFATEGQSWGLAAPSPRALVERDFAPFRNMVAAQMRYAGALRIDHAMALWQLFLVPEGRSPKEGTHLRYPFAEMLTVLAEQSQEHRTLIIGEDLGFVPEGFRDAMAEVGILSYRILYFEKKDDAFIELEDYPPLALACLSTHDLPTLASWWCAEDVTLRQAHGLVDRESSAEHRTLRTKERAALIAVLSEAGLLEWEIRSDKDELPTDLLVAAHQFIARTPSLLATVRLADMAGPLAPTNLPGTVDAYPNWQLRSPTTIENLPTHPTFLAVTGAIAQERPRRDQGLYDSSHSSFASGSGVEG